jgi:hypothetical protein
LLRARSRYEAAADMACVYILPRIQGPMSGTAGINRSMYQ